MAKDKQYEKEYQLIKKLRATERRRRKASVRRSDEYTHGKGYRICDHCGGHMSWCSCCQMWSAYCCEEYGTCMCS